MNKIVLLMLELVVSYNGSELLLIFILDYF